MWTPLQSLIVEEGMDAGFLQARSPSCWQNPLDIPETVVSQPPDRGNIPAQLAFLVSETL